MVGLHGMKQWEKINFLLLMTAIQIRLGVTYMLLVMHVVMRLAGKKNECFSQIVGPGIRCGKKDREKNCSSAHHFPLRLFMQ